MVSNTEPGDGGERPRSVVGRYALYDQLASGGMASVHIGRLMGLAGFSRTVAIKRLHPHLAKDHDFVAMLLDEARLVVRVRHPNVVPVIDVVQDGNELLLVMEYVQGEPLNVLMRLTMDRGERMPLKMVRSVIAGVLHGLHAAHESTDEKGQPLGIVHRDVSPQNIIVGVDGVARVLDFGIAKATGRLQMTREGEIKGKTAYMSPEQLRGESVDRRTDVYAASVLLWEMLTTRRLFRGQTQPEIAYKVLEDVVAAPSQVAPDLSVELDAIVMRGLARNPDDRFSTALEMAIAIEDLGDLATSRATGLWVEEKGSDRLRERAAIIAAIESSSFQRASLSKLSIGSASSLGPAKPDLPTMIEGARTRADASASSLLDGQEAFGPGETGPQLPSARYQAPFPAPSAAPQAQSRMIVLVAVASLTAVLSLIIAGWLFLHRGSSPPAPVPGAATASVGASAAASVLATPSASPSSAPSSAPSSLASSAASPPPSASASARPTMTGARPGHPPATAKPARAACDPPYALDSRGIRIPKPECL